MSAFRELHRERVRYLLSVCKLARLSWCDEWSLSTAQAELAEIRRGIAMYF